MHISNRKQTNKENNNLKNQNNHPPPSRTAVSVGENDRNPPTLKNQKASNLYIATLNTLTLRTDERLQELVNALQCIKWDILGLSEVRRVGDTIEEYSDYIFYYKGETKGKYGVGFMIKKELKKHIIEFRGVSERIALLNIKLPGFNDYWSILQVYAPTEAADDESKDNFYINLNEALDTCYKNILVMGDFNGRIGKQNSGEESIMGKYGTGVRSPNGERMINMALENKLKFMNSCFKKNPSKKWTWMSPDGLYRNEIDHILCNQPRVVRDINVLSQLNFNTNHRMVRATIHCTKQKLSRRNFNQHNYYKSSQSPRSPNYTERNKETTINIIQQTYDNEINSMYQTIKLEGVKNEVLSPTTKNLIQKRKGILKLKEDKTVLKEITKISKEISNSIKKDRARRKMELGPELIMDQFDLDLRDATTDNLYPALFQCFAIILCGYIAGRLNVVSPLESKGIATFVGTFALPSLIFLSLARLDFTTVNWTFLVAILLAKGLVFFSVILVTLMVSKPLNLARAGIFAIFCTQSNDFALGYPIINAIYQKTHPEYALYLYLMAPISLAILNPVAFVLMEITKQKESTQAITNEEERRKSLAKLKLLKQIVKGIAFNPVLAMTVLGIFGNVLFKHKLSIYIEGLLEVFGQAFSASALFLLGLRMVGQFHRLKGPALVLPCVLIMVKLIILPVVMRECVSGLRAGTNDSETSSLSTYAFLYGTIPTAPAVFVFSNLYQLEIDLMASSMVICTFVSAPMMYLSAQVISINKDYQEQLKKFGFDLSIVALIATIWIIIVFVVTKKYKRMPHRLTLCLITSQLILAVSVIWGGPLISYTPSWHVMLQQVLRTFGMYSCLLWTSMLSVGILLLESRGPCFVVTVWPVLGFVAWGAPAVMVTILVVTSAGAGELNEKAIDAIRLCLLVFCLTVTTGCLIVYIRFRRRSAQFATLSAEVAGSSPPDETTSLVENAEPISSTQSVSNNTDLVLEDPGCYGTITATPSPNKNGSECCSNDPNCKGLNMSINAQDIEDIVEDDKECACPASQRARCSARVAGGSCQYLSELERPGLRPPEPARGRGAQLLQHTVLVIASSLTMFIGITYLTWKMMKKDESGVFVEIEFFDIAANYGQALVMFVIFGLDPEEIAIPAIRYFKKQWHGADTLVLPAIEDLPFETKHVCEQFITHHLERCREAIAKDTRWRMRTYRGVFRGACLVRWLVRCGLARDEREALQYGRHLLDGRLIAHINHAHHFTNSQLLYTFN